ncbi:4-hydroxy-tetrahydrodipicolinate synthase [Cyclobacterium xiamenense]|uniref:4-hydroxy-tetrahydrodipicolinate synthase n=1 Tax=Cyclobacterium xiamenense TaxID=1297121 RepID=A0A1H6TBB6_9BACT|nr:dihydrodipicolinate synthase family protein [Cyclobacterium xiamenense]SEI76556.1 4-hydroxy-tetrahydrodipicolinate synthase [Cyclobacterium xiamenense]
MIKWKGVFPAITTKFTSDDKLDLNAFHANIKVQLKAGIDGIIIGGSLGEASTLSDREKEVLVQSTVELVSDKIPVVLTIAEQSTKKAVELAQAAQESGIKGLMVLPPMRYYADSRETLAFFREVAAATDLSIMVYNNPIDYKILVTPDMFEELASCKNIQAVKDSSRDLTLITKMINRFGDRFKILAGVDPLALESLVLGAHGWVAGLVCAFPYETVAIYRLVKEGRIAEALEIYRWFFPLLELDIHPKLVQYIKLAEVATGLGTEYVRAPRLMLSGEERKQIWKIIEDSLAVRPDLPTWQKMTL